MSTPKPLTAADTTAAVDAFMAKLEHPHKPEVQALRELILATGSDVAEGIKWNAPSYRTHEYFATTNLRAKGGVGIILHLGAKVRDTEVRIDDPENLLVWHGANRASFQISGMDDLRSKSAALRAILAQWLPHV